MDHETLCKRLAKIKQTVFDVSSSVKENTIAKQELYCAIRRIKAVASHFDRTHFFHASDLFNEIDDRPVSLETFMDAGCNVPEIATLTGEKMTDVQKQRLPLYRPIERLPILAQQVDNYKDRLEKIEKKFWRWYNGRRKHGLSGDDMTFINDLDNRGVVEVREILDLLNTMRYGRIISHFENKYNELFELDSVQQGVNNGWVRKEFDRGMECNDNHLFSGMPLGYLNVGRGLRRLAVKDGWTPMLFEYPEKNDESEIIF